MFLTRQDNATVALVKQVLLKVSWVAIILICAIVKLHNSESGLGMVLLFYSILLLNDP